MSDRDAPGPAALTRRALLAGTCGLLLAGVAAAPAEASTAVRTLPDGRLAVHVNRIPELAQVGGAVSVGSVKGTPVAVVRTATGYKAMSLRCPHQGVTVKRDATGWLCPAHGSEFTSTGALELGPATRGLSTVPSALRRGTLTIG